MLRSFGFRRDPVKTASFDGWTSKKATGWDYSVRILKKGWVYRMKRMLYLVLLLTLGGCAAVQDKQEAPKTADPQADKAAIDKVREKFYDEAIMFRS